MSRSRKKPAATSAAEVIARRVRQLRTERGWSAQRLADRLAEVDPTTILGRDVIANLENGRRREVSIDELLLLAYALDEPPWSLCTPSVDEASLRIGTVVVDPVGAWSWMATGGRLHGQDRDRFGRMAKRIAELTPIPDDSQPTPEVLESMIDILRRAVYDMRNPKGGE
jgi:transcriptional regulator with XRE-family HTH domain